MKVEAIVTDDEMEKAFANANFGSMSNREVLRLAVLKCASGYHQGFTSRQIAIELGLITDKYNITKKGRDYLWEAFAGQTNF